MDNEKKKTRYSLHLVENQSDEWLQFHNIQRFSLFEQTPEESYDPNFHDNNALASGARRFALLLKCDGFPVGITTLDVEETGRGITRGVAVDTQMQGNGHGRILGILVEQFARSHGLRALCVNADPSKTGYYAKLGFDRHTWSDAELELWRAGRATSPAPVQMMKKLR